MPANIPMPHSVNQPTAYRKLKSRTRAKRYTATAPTTPKPAAVRIWIDSGLTATV